MAALAARVDFLRRRLQAEHVPPEIAQLPFCVRRAGEAGKLIRCEVPGVPRQVLLMGGTVPRLLLRGTDVEDGIPLRLRRNAGFVRALNIRVKWLAGRGIHHNVVVVDEEESALRGLEQAEAIERAVQVDLPDPLLPVRGGLGDFLQNILTRSRCLHAHLNARLAVQRKAGDAV